MTIPRLRIGQATEAINDPRGRVEIYAEPRDGWIGFYVAPDAVYVCPLPFVVIRVSRGRKS